MQAESFNFFKKNNTKVPIKVKYERIMENVLNFENRPEKMLIDKKVKKVLWKILLDTNNFDKKWIGKVWMLASGASNLMHMNPNYYFTLRDQTPEYPNPCFN